MLGWLRLGDLLIRSSGRTVQDRPAVAACWADVPRRPLVREHRICCALTWRSRCSLGWPPTRFGAPGGSMAWSRWGSPAGRWSKGAERGLGDLAAAHASRGRHADSQVEANAASGYVCPGDDAAESLVVGVVVAPDDVAADHAGLFLVGGVVGAVEGEVAQRGELRLYAV
jgi:hypothetical protein